MAGFAPKTEVHLDPPKDDPIDLEELAKCDGTNDGKPIYVAIKGESVCRAEFWLLPQCLGYSGTDLASSVLPLVRRLHPSLSLSPKQVLSLTFPGRRTCTGLEPDTTSVSDPREQLT